MAHDDELTEGNGITGRTISSSEWGKEIKIGSQRIKSNLEDIQTKIAPCKPKIIGVTKYYGVSSIIDGYNAGLRDFAESRAIDSIEKIKSLPEEVRAGSKFHFIGHLQSNKAAKVVENFDCIHSVDSLKIAEIISKVASEHKKTIDILLQVNNAKEEQKFGFDVTDLRRDFPEIIKLENLNVIGLMNMAPLGASENVLRKVFGDLRILRDELRTDFKAELPELSMGMSDDYEIAVKEGATMIRIGRKLFN